MTEHWSQKYLGMPWVPLGRGPDQFDCYGFLWWVYRTEFHTTLSTDAHVDPTSPIAVVRAMEKEIPARTHIWQRTFVPVEGCAVALSKNKKIHHVGVYTSADGGLLVHCVDYARVTAQSLRALRAFGWRRIEFYKHISLHGHNC